MGVNLKKIHNLQENLENIGFRKCLHVCIGWAGRMNELTCRHVGRAKFISEFILLFVWVQLTLLLIRTTVVIHLVVKCILRNMGAR